MKNETLIHGAKVGIKQPGEHCSDCEHCSACKGARALPRFPEASKELWLARELAKEIPPDERLPNS
jgi:hypothetical protein